MRRISSLSLAGLTLLSACTTLSDMPAGTPLTELEKHFGAPTISCPSHTTPPQRLVWSMQPMGQYAWGVEVNHKQELLNAEQVLQDKYFALLNEGIWDKERVHCYFGPPANKDMTPYLGVKMEVWSYRYKQNATWDSLMYVYFNDEGVVKHHHPGPDPRYEDGMFPLF